MSDEPMDCGAGLGIRLGDSFCCQKHRRITEEDERDDESWISPRSPCSEGREEEALRQESG